jgi:PelA/Pel-15E family pectate lyase
MTYTYRAAYLLAILILTSAAPAPASVIGTNPPAESITKERIAQLPSVEQHAWQVYLDRSWRQRQADKDFLSAEMKRSGLSKFQAPPESPAARSIPLNHEPSWYASNEARHIADVIVSFQTPAGGWGKNIDMSKEQRRPGEAFTSNNLSRFLASGDFDIPREADWNYVGTIDNDATTTQMRFLARTVSALKTKDRAPFRSAFLRGMNYLFEAQFPNGGWPQVWPLEGGYHDAITYNDDAMINVMELMRHIADGEGEYSFVPGKIRKRAASSFARGIQCVFATQIKVNGKRTIWPQQDDALTLQPVSARNFEPPAQCASESASLLLMLMNDLGSPSAAQQEAIRAVAKWFRETAIYGQSWGQGREGRELVPTSGAGPIWARFYQVATDRPVFGDRDKSIRDDVTEISKERRKGYRWYSSDPQSALDRFEIWNKVHTESK